MASLTGFLSIPTPLLRVRASCRSVSGYGCERVGTKEGYNFSLLSVGPVSLWLLDREIRNHGNVILRSFDGKLGGSILVLLWVDLEIRSN